MRQNIRANNLAQAVELIHVVQHSLDIVASLIERDFSRETPPKISPRKGTGGQQL